MKILVTGATGLVGSALVPALAAAGHEVVPLGRSEPKSGTRGLRWDPERGVVDAAALDGFDAAVHLAGENIASRWTAAAKSRIRESRIRGTRLLAEALAAASKKPRVLVSASAIGFYGDRGDEVVDENSPPGSGFLPETCVAWEAATAPAAAAGIRVVCARIGIVLSSRGGALAKMLPPFRLGLGGRVGSGNQYLSWVANDELARIIEHALLTESLSGPVNAVGPEPCTNAEFTRALARALRRPAFFPLPAFAVRLLFGEMGETLLLGGNRVRPTRLAASGFRFRHLEVAAALESALRGP